MRDDEFERLYAAEAAGLFSFLAYRTGDRALAEDLLADAFERALRARGGRQVDRAPSVETGLRGLSVSQAPVGRPRCAHRLPLKAASFRT